MSFLVVFLIEIILIEILIRERRDLFVFTYLFHSIKLDLSLIFSFNIPVLCEERGKIQKFKFLFLSSRLKLKKVEIEKEKRKNIQKTKTTPLS